MMRMAEFRQAAHSTSVRPATLLHGQLAQLSSASRRQCAPILHCRIKDAENSASCSAHMRGKLPSVEHLGLQIRSLAMSKKSELAAMGAILGLYVFSAAPAIAAKGCTLYARQAVSQYNFMRSTPSCAKGDNARWHGNYGIHYNWCKANEPQGGGDWSPVWRESTIREKYLCRCTRKCM